MPRIGESALALADRSVAFLMRLGAPVVLALHHLARRLDLVPPEFGRESTVDEADPGAISAEWRGYFRLWASRNPEEIFALKIGGVLVAAILITLLLAIPLIF